MSLGVLTMQNAVCVNSVDEILKQFVSREKENGKIEMDSQWFGR